MLVEIGMACLLCRCEGEDGLMWLWLRVSLVERMMVDLVLVNFRFGRGEGRHGRERKKMMMAGCQEE